MKRVMSRQLLLIAKAPVPGRVKTRLCPPCTPEQAAAVAAAALADTIAVLSATPAVHRTLVVHGDYPAPTGWHMVPQRGDGLGERLANAFADTARPGVATLLVGMDTPQLSLVDCPPGNALGLAEDGGWWALQLENPADARVLRSVPMSTPDTGRLTLAGLRNIGLVVQTLPVLRDVDTAEDAHAVAALRPGSRFARAVHTMVPEPVR
jgi:glycosyltransferase A (GT-A) superfamily protein (DUF2064 family)